MTTRYTLARQVRDALNAGATAEQAILAAGFDEDGNHLEGFEAYREDPGLDWNDGDLIDFGWSDEVCLLVVKRGRGEWYLEERTQID